MNRATTLIFHWLPLAFTATAVSGLLYLTVQQNYRQSLDDPQIEMVRNMALALEGGMQPVDVVPRQDFDAGKSLTMFVAVYGSNGAPLEASAHIDGAPPKPPIGVFDNARTTGENRVTWQPNLGTRIALVVRPVKGGSGWYVAAGRNMEEVEARIANTTKIIGSGLLVILITSFILELIGDLLRRRAMMNANKP